ncbi:MAG: hypothetical protein IIX11_02785 [Selenomonadales bacterium]|nr:hypothetical protein [Selenomonadales bacterium]MBR0325041.1 hypothetical protein [Selenomonadales bacterium]
MNDMYDKAHRLRSYFTPTTEEYRDNDIISERRLPQPRSEGLPARIALLGHLLAKTRSDQTATHSA